MPTIVVTLADLPAELRSVPARDAAAIRRAVVRTLNVDAHRWIQWSIRGGGVAPPAPRTAKGPKRKKRRKKGVLSKLLAVFRKKKLGPQSSSGSEKSKTKVKMPAYRMPIDTGDYANSWRSEVFDDGGGIFYSAANPPIKAGVIEEGRRPAPIPIEPLANWVRRKFGKDMEDARSIAFGISKHAAKNRRPGLYVLKRAHPKIAEALAKNLERELRASAKARASVKVL